MYQQAIDTVVAKGLIRSRYDNFIGGKFVAPVDGQYFDNPSPITGAKLCEVARSNAADIELALDAAHKAKDAWGKTAPAERATSSPRSPTAWRRISTCWRSSNARQRQADPRDDRRRPAAVRRSLAYFAGGFAHKRARFPNRPQTGGLSLPRAAWRRRQHQPVELPDADGGVEARPRSPPAIAWSSSRPNRPGGASSSRWG